MSATWKRILQYCVVFLAHFSLGLRWDLWEEIRYISALENPLIRGFVKVAMGLASVSIDL